MRSAWGDKGKGGNNWKVRHTTSKAAWNSEEGGETTVVLTRLPKTLNAEILLDLLDELFPCAYDYFYLPMDMDKFENQGLAYINFRDHETAVQCQNHFEAREDWGKGHVCERPCKSEWSSIQGYAACIEKAANIERQQRSAAAWVTMDIPEDCKPMAFDEHGRRLPTFDIFPASVVDTGKDSRSWRTVSYSNKEEGSKWWKDQWYGGSSSEQHDGKNGKSRGWYDSWSRKDDDWRDHGSRSKWNDEGSWRDWTRRDDDWDDGDAAFSDTRASNRIWRTSNRDPEDEHDEYGEASQNSDNFEHGMTDEKQEEEWVPWKRREEEKENEAGKDDNLATKVPILKDQPPLASLLGISSNEPPALLKSAEAALASAKYACPHCGAVFMKWSACMHHIVTDSRTCRDHILPDGKMPADMTELQEKCKAKAAEMPKDVKKGKPEADAPAEKRRFQ